MLATTPAPEAAAKAEEPIVAKDEATTESAVGTSTQRHAQIHLQTSNFMNGY